MHSDRLIIRLNDVSYRLGSKMILSNINWVLRQGEDWAVLGANGSGKSTFLRLVRGDIWPMPGHGARTYYNNGEPNCSPMAFKPQTGLVSSELLDRYKHLGWNIAAREAVCSGFWDTAYVFQKPEAWERDRVEEVMVWLGLEPLADRNILTLSLGEAKRVLIARALVHEPRLLLLDEVFDGLDQVSRRTVRRIIQKAAESGTQLLCAAHVIHDLVPAITHALTLEAGRIVTCGKKAFSVPRTPSGSTEPACFTPDVDLPGRKPSSSVEFLIEVEHADVFLQGKHILKAIDWTIKPDESWALVGENGSGKTTLLNLILGDVSPALGGNVHRFGREGLRSIWEIRRQISLVSPDLQAEHVWNQTGLETVLSGFFGSIGLHRPATAEQYHLARRWLHELDLAHLAERDVLTLSYGQARMLLIARAMVTQPKILLLDEPLSGLDGASRQDVLGLIDRLSRRGTTVVHVSHRREDVIGSSTHVAIMKTGKIVFKGTRNLFEALFL